VADGSEGLSADKCRARVRRWWPRVRPCLRVAALVFCTWGAYCWYRNPGDSGHRSAGYELIQFCLPYGLALTALSLGRASSFIERGFAFLFLAVLVLCAHGLKTMSPFAFVLRTRSLKDEWLWHSHVLLCALVAWLCTRAVVFLTRLRRRMPRPFRAAGLYLALAVVIYASAFLSSLLYYRGGQLTWLADDCLWWEPLDRLPYAVLLTMAVTLSVVLTMPVMLVFCALYDIPILREARPRQAKRSGPGGGDHPARCACGPGSPGGFGRR